MILPALWIAVHHRQSPIEIRDALVIGRVGIGGRVPVVQDPIVAKLVRGEPVSPRAGDSLTTPRGTTALWRGVTANADGIFEGNELRGGYVYATVDSPEDQVMLLEAAGDTLVYVNGSPRAGDPYGTGYVRLPVQLKKGTNEFLFSVGRGQLRARLLPTDALQQIDTGDVTLPDVIPTDKGNLFGSIVVINSSPTDATDLSIACAGDGKSVRTALPRIPAMSIRKVAFDFPVGPKDLDLVLMRGDAPVHSARVTVRNRDAGQVYKRTFVSSIDGTVQYYAVNPSTKPDAGNALILSVHGASVEALGQAEAYSAKPWATLVAATNRRPYGFDWEDWGRLDALEVLDDAGSKIPHDPKRVVLTGHSMGGHGSWSIGSLYPDRFGAVAPSAGWISFWSYAGGWEPRDPTPPEAMVRRSMAPSDTLARITNLVAQSVYILHGDADDNVPVEQARTMSKVLSADGIAFGYHEEKGAGHWWGSQCVDYPDLMATLQSARISDFSTVDFTTPDPAVSSTCGWFSIDQQIHPRLVSHVKGDTTKLATENVRSLTFLRAVPSITLDGQTLNKVSAGETFIRSNDKWKSGKLGENDRRTGFSGPLKQAFTNRFVLVYGTTGTAEENRWSRDKARFDAESFYYRGNGSPEVVSDGVFLQDGFKGRNAIVYGNATTNLAWAKLLKASPIHVEKGETKIGKRKIEGDGTSVAFIYPSAKRLVAAIGGADLAGMRQTDRLPIITSGTAFPDWIILGGNSADKGSKGILGAGFFGPNWGLPGGEEAWTP